MHQSIAAAPSRGWGLLSCQKRGQMPPPPSTLQHFSLIAQSNNAVLSIFLMCEFFVSINVFLWCSTRVLTKTSRRDDMHPVYGFSIDIKLLTLKLIECFNVMLRIAL